MCKNLVRPPTTNLVTKTAIAALCAARHRGEPLQQDGQNVFRDYIPLMYCYWCLYIRLYVHRSVTVINSVTSGNLWPVADVTLPSRSRVLGLGSVSTSAKRTAPAQYPNFHDFRWMFGQRCIRILPIADDILSDLTVENYRRSVIFICANTTLYETFAQVQFAQVQYVLLTCWVISTWERSEDWSQPCW